MMKKLIKTRNLWTLAAMISLLFSSCSSDDSGDDGPVQPQFPVSDFTYVADGLEVTFTDTSTNAVSYSWDFGDSATSSEKNPVHMYAADGAYTVKLTTTNAAGNNHEKQESINVTANDPCEGQTGIDPDGKNILLGGQFETCDAVYWTVNKVGEPELVKYEFGYTDYTPAAGTDGSLYIYPDNDATTENEASFFYQKVTAVDGEYQIAALIKLLGESESDPESAMNQYWFEFYVGTTEPVDGEDYTDNQVSGWFYGVWTGGAYLIPPTDGPLVHDYLAGNVASEDGKFNLDDGDYYVGIKVGKAGAGSFGDGIAIDDFSLERVGDRNECFDYDGVQEGNLVKGGQFEECDAKYWTILSGDANLPIGPYEFGNTAYAPMNGTGGAFYVGDIANSSGTMYQYVGNLEAGTYQLNAEVKLGGVESGMDQFWYEILVYSEEPEEGVGYSPVDENDAAIPRVAGYINAAWGGVVDAMAHDGELQYDYTNGNTADADGNFTITEGGDHFFVLKWGTFEGSLGDGISMDNLSLVKID